MAPQFLIMKVHRCHQVSLRLKEDQPDLGAPLLQAAWTSRRQPPRHHPRCPQHRPKVAGECSYHTDWLHFKFLASDCKGAVHTASQSSLSPSSSLCSSARIVPFPSPPPRSAAHRAACLAGKIEANRWELPPLAATKCTHLPTPTPATGLSPSLTLG